MERSLVGHDKIKPPVKLFGFVAFIVEVSVGRNLVSFNLAHPFKTTDSFDGVGEILDTPDGLNDQDLFWVSASSRLLQFHMPRVEFSLKLREHWRQALSLPAKRGPMYVAWDSVSL
ncbi:MAG: hypothetical protein E4G99_11885 [Anaerolineales bacterium]|nr:MAG: hypothetical protein E4G99_11885 [Anaerolineales bacterium]